MNKNYTLKELAEIYMGSPMPESACTNTVRAGIQKVLDAIGYEFPKDEEREAFEQWLESNPKRSSNDDLLEAWKAGREELRKEFCSDKCEDAKPKEPAWIPWAGGECPLPDTVKRWEIKCRDGVTFVLSSAPRCYKWSHEGICGDIVAYRVWEG